MEQPLAEEASETSRITKPDYREKYERAVLRDTRWIVDEPGDKGWCPDGAELADDSDLFPWIDIHLPLVRTCSYCKERLNAVVVDAFHDEDSLSSERDASGDFGDSRVLTSTPKDVRHHLSQWVDPIYRLWTCDRCGFWQWCSLEFYRGGFNATIATPVVRTFERVLPAGCERELAQQIARHSHRLCELTPSRLETLVADIFRANYQHGETRHIGRPGDGGVDVLLVDDGGRQWIIQVKRRAEPTAVEGVETIRNLIGTMMVEGQPRGIVVTTADHFSHFAHESAMRAKARSQGRLLEIKLGDRHLLRSLIGELIPLNGWRTPLKDGRVCFRDNIAVLETHCMTALGPNVPTSRQLELFPRLTDR